MLGFEKFLKTCWNADPERGEANFDIDDDKIQKGQYNIFTNDIQKPKKVDLFERELREKIMTKILVTDKDIYLFTLSNGFLPYHARKVVSSMIRDDKIQKCNLNLTTEVCKTKFPLTQVKLK
ncbi:hypothetical protein MUK70_21105 [Dyadobacter chenwenxiniae]|uniref:GMT-like wHTH domain-containing protein n=1 Tax=Dyadobacter chenwenxiniae TaxID=2906456 RepID=A0A9X1PI68_9BACT|nr:hypothetical protein [Dyadobacter chenwenxiniae]MCF0061742.1 hypothetical protein [Dyadobacter chenwenxiniae]UON81560.1 hypothetical protein MUK70_21105 [Dyadobacter chenwenxiniae]